MTDADPEERGPAGTPVPVALQAVLGTSSDALLVFDLEGRLVYHNERFRAWFDLPETALVGEEDRAIAEEMSDLFREPERFLRSLEEIYRRPAERRVDTFALLDGRVLERETRPVRGDGEVGAVAVSWRDVTELRENERRLRAAQRVARLGSWEWEIQENRLHWSDELYRMFDVDPESFEADLDAFLERVHEGDRAKLRRTVERALESGERYDVEFRVVRPDGEIRHLYGAGEPVANREGQPFLLRGVAQDITGRRQLEQRYRTLFELSPQAVVVSTPEGRILDVNRAATEMLGWDEEEFVGRDVGSLQVWVEPEDRERVLGRLRDGQPVRGFQTRLRTASGEVREVELSVAVLDFGEELRLTFAIKDVTEELRYRRQLERQSLRDSLTGLANRNLLLDRLEHALGRARGEETEVAVVFLDLDDLKAVNDSYGHATGDQVLQEVGERLGRCLDGEDTLARIASDEFVAVLEGTGEEEARRVAERFLAALEDPFEIDGLNFTMSGSVGVAVREAGQELERAVDLLHAADAAMHRMKREGGDGYRHFGPEDASAAGRLERRERLQRAIRDDELVLYYQPVVDLRTGRAVGAEALVRWEHPDEGLLGPGEFIPLAEETGLIGRLDVWVLREAIRQGARWRADSAFGAASEEFSVAVNVAPHRYRLADLGEEVLRTAREARLPPDALQLEITERLALQDTRPFERLREEGVELLIDDFGTGYSSLMYLRHLDADGLKIDRFFVQELEDEDRTSVIVSSVLAIARQLGLTVVAEGVETADQRDHLAAIGCPFAQGFFYARPMPADELKGYVKEADG